MRAKTTFLCQACGHQAPRWLGRCPDCGRWNTMKEERLPASGRGRPPAASAGPAQPTPFDTIEIGRETRASTGMHEFDRVLGGGVVPGSVVLIGGDPGIGKSTLLLSALPRLARDEEAVLYVSGEESLGQIKMRGDRLGIKSSTLYVLAETSCEQIIRHAQDLRPAAVVVDSIQTMYTDQVTSAPGSITQVQEVAAQLMWLAKRSGVPVFLIGHVTKEGAIAGPRLLEHIVDSVLYFEGDRGHRYRILRAVKNRFGSTNEIGVFEMKEGGLEEVANPSAVFLEERPERSTGSVVVACIEGSRPILVEVQALVSPTGYAMPKRMANGVDLNRLALLLAVLEKRCGVQLSGQDVYVNVVGGIHIDEPAIDLALAVAVTSSLRNRPVDSRTVVFGEVGLGGEVRTVSQADLRLKEAAKLGFRRAVLPDRNVAKLDLPTAMELVGVAGMEQALEALSA